MTSAPPPFPQSALDRLAFSTYLGGAGADQTNAIAIDGNDNVYVVGLTATPGLLPTPGAFDTTLGGEYDGFVAKLNATGTVGFITYLGGSGSDIVLDVSIDGSGSVLVCGSTDSADFPTTASALDQSYNGGRDAFFAVLSGDGAALRYATYLGGAGRDECGAIALSASGDVYLMGPTYSSDFPTTLGSYEPAFGGSGNDIFVSRLAWAGGALVFSTYLGDVFDGSDLAVDAVGSAIVVGTTDSQYFPTTANAFDATIAGTDGFVAKLSADGSALLYGSFLGGTDTDWILAAAVTADGVVDVTGYTHSSDFPTTGGAPGRSYRGGIWDAFVARLSLQGGLLYSTYLGGAGDDFGMGIALDGAGAMYAMGETSSSDFPTTSTAISTINSGSGDAYFLKLDSSGASISYSTYFGGSGWDSPWDFALDREGNFFLTGSTSSVDLPVTGGAFATTLNGSFDAFLASAPIPQPNTPGDEGATTILWLLVIAPLGGSVAAAVVVWLRSRRRRKGSDPPETQAPGK